MDPDCSLRKVLHELKTVTHSSDHRISDEVISQPLTDAYRNKDIISDESDMPVQAVSNGSSPTFHWKRTVWVSGKK